MAYNEAVRRPWRHQKGETERQRTAGSQFEGNWAVVQRVLGAMLRALLTVALIAAPSIMLPNVSADASQVVALVAIAAAALVFFEYVAVYPGLIEFRDAPPFNRIRFFSLALNVVLLSEICRGIYTPTVVSQFVTAVGGLIGVVMDFPYSPVRFMVESLPEDAPTHAVALIRVATGMAYLTSLVSLAIFYLALQLDNWPGKSNKFNVWINLPTFDPTVGGDVVARLRRDARVNTLLGAALPFLIPLILSLASTLFGAITVGNYQSVIWIVSAWAFLPASLFMRGIAMSRIALMIEDQRRATYATANVEPALA